MANEYLKHVSIMVIDDQEFICRLIREVLHVIGGNLVTFFTDPKKAWEEFKIRPCDIVIMDWEMQPIDGLALTKLIRKSPDSPNPLVPIIMVTGYGEMSRVLKARDAGVTEYIIKPISPKALYGRLEAVIERPRRFVRVGEFFGPDRRRHVAEYEGKDRRGVGDDEAVKTKLAEKEKEKKAPVDKKKQMGQEEVNDLFNPNEVAKREAAEANKK